LRGKRERRRWAGARLLKTRKKKQGKKTGWNRTIMLHPHKKSEF